MKKIFLKKKVIQRGFTLVETLVVLALFTILTLVITGSVASFYRLNGYVIAQAYQVDNARRGTEQLVRDIREMTFSDNGAFPLATIEDYSISFFSDVDYDQSVEYIEYTVSSTTLLKKIFSATGSPPVYSTTTPESVTTVSEYVQNELQGIPMFVYYDTEGVPATATTSITDIRYVQTSVIVNIDPIRDPGQFMLRSSVALRNLKN